MFDAARIRQDFSDAALRYDGHAALQQKVLSRLLEKAAPSLADRGPILDAGCGTGRLARELSGYPVIQLDSAFAMCRAAAPSAPAINACMENLPFAGHYFSTVFSSLALQWADDSALALRELKRVLKPGGLLAVSTFGEGTLKELKESFAAVDDYPHISPFVPAASWDESETITEHYPDLRSLMLKLKAIGARNKRADRRKSLMTPWALRKLEDYYRSHFGGEEGLRATWNVLYKVECKA